MMIPLIRSARLVRRRYIWLYSYPSHSLLRICTCRTKSYHLTCIIYRNSWFAHFKNVRFFVSMLEIIETVKASNFANMNANLSQFCLSLSRQLYTYRFVNVTEAIITGFLMERESFLKSLHDFPCTKFPLPLRDQNCLSRPIPISYFSAIFQSRNIHPWPMVQC